MDHIAGRELNIEISRGEITKAVVCLILKALIVLAAYHYRSFAVIPLVIILVLATLVDTIGRFIEFHMQ